MSAYAVQRLFLHVSQWLAGPAFGCAVAYLSEGDYRSASISAGVCTIMLIYWFAFYERRDTTPRK